MSQVCGLFKGSTCFNLYWDIRNKKYRVKTPRGLYDASTIDLAILFSGDIPLFYAETH